MKIKDNYQRALIFYLIFIFSFSIPIYYFAKKAPNSDAANVYLTLLMFTPLVAAIISSLITKVKIVWGKPSIKYLLIGLVFPYIVLLTYFVASKFGILTYTNGINWISILPNVILGSILAIGEEVGWRGYVLPILRSKYGFLISNTLLATIWLVFHVPVILLGLYGNNALPLYQQLIFFSLNIFAFSFIIGILWEYSRNIWTATVAHASWNYLLQSVLVASFVATNAWLVGEFGFLPLIGLSVILIFASVIFKLYPPKAQKERAAKNNE